MGEFLYNGIPLPKLPENDNPYAYILRRSNGSYLLYFRDSIATANADGSISAVTGTKYEVSNNAWVKVATATIAIVVWANHDVYYNEAAGGTLYLAASDPVPVVTNTLDPTALLMGWLAGKRMAAMRGNS